MHSNWYRLIFLLGIIIISCKPRSKQQETQEPAFIEQGTPYQKKIQKAYEYKKTGHNGAALEIFNKVEKYAPKGSVIYASLLDDKASVLIRTGQVKQAQKKYEQALEIMNKEKGNLDLKAGIETRLEILKQMNNKNIVCKEFLEPPKLPKNEKPYFPDITRYQEALGTLTPKLADCKKGNTIEGIAMRMHITNKGELIHASSRGDFEGTNVEKCVIQRLEKLLPSLEKPEFSACFRGFSYTFMLGPHPK